MADRIVRRLLAIVAVVVLIFALREMEPVTLPLAFALFLMTLFWPVFAWIAGRASAGWEEFEGAPGGAG